MPWRHRNRKGAGNADVVIHDAVGAPSGSGERE